MNIEELAFKDRITLAQLNELVLLDIIEFLQLDRKQWISQFTQTHNKSVDIQKENQELKKQLENNSKINVADHKYASTCEDKVIILETQQKEFIKYLEDEIKELQKIKETELDYDILQDVIPELLVCKDVLQKYKEIIGVSDEINNLRRINMKYYYEYKEKNGCKVGGHNLENIDFFDNYIRLLGVDIIPTNYDYEKQHWGILLDMNEIEYLKIEPMNKTTN